MNIEDIISFIAKKLDGQHQAIDLKNHIEITPDGYW